MNRYLITPSLLNSWQYYINYEGDKENEVKVSFLADLNKERREPSEAMLKGIEFENLVHAFAENWTIPKLPDDKLLIDCAWEIAEIVKGGAWQSKVYKDMIVDGISFFLYGKIDVLKGACAYDIKFTGNYEIGKFLNSAQHALYLECIDVPYFQYLASDGSNVWREEYKKSETLPIEVTIRKFITWLPNDWKKIYFEKWKSKNENNN